MSEERERTGELVRRSLDPKTTREFEDRLDEQAEWLRAAVDDGRMSNDDFAIGLELEVYAVAADGPTDADPNAPEADGPRLTPLPDAVFESDVVNKELGVHNAEINTEPTLLSGEGLAAQAAEIRGRTETARETVRDHGYELVLDSMWTLPPEEGSIEFLSSITERDGVVFAENMRQAPRYVALDNQLLEYAAEGSIRLSVPGVDREFPTILVESLATSIQPHLQIPTAAELPTYYNIAIRTLAPTLALSTNSPFLPGDMYIDVDDPETLTEETHDELRIAVFEQAINQTPNGKVRVPRDIGTTTDVVDRVREDDLCAPFLREWVEDEPVRDTLSDRIWEFDHKRGTYWRWLRCVIGGEPIGPNNDEHSLRIEYRPIPCQPTVTDVIGMQALVVGLIHGLVRADHPITELPWDVAESNFYRAAESGLDAEIDWITVDGDRTTDADRMFEEVFSHARRGLRAAGVPDDDIDRYLSPITRRWEVGVTPSDWKRTRVRSALEDGAELEEAIAEMQRDYLRRSRETDSFSEWLSETE